MRPFGVIAEAKTLEGNRHPIRDRSTRRAGFVGHISYGELDIEKPTQIVSMVGQYPESR